MYPIIEHNSNERKVKDSSSTKQTFGDEDEINVELISKIMMELVPELPSL